MKKIIIALIFLISINIATAAQAENYNDYSSLEVDFTLESNVNLEGSGSLKQLSATVFLNPIENKNQDVISFDPFSTPQASTETDPDLKFTWKDKSPSYNFGYNTKIKTNNVLYPVPEITFPYDTLDSSYQKYLQSEEIIDITPDIVAQASEIIGNEDNAYLAVNKLAYWTHTNIEYSLNTLTETASERSSWVLENKQGVCDELTSLFISMVRSIGIPARFVSGMAYTNAGYYFGNHGWAEVYFEGYGWVPYDVTYGQYGWVDPSHIYLQISEDIESSITYQWQYVGDLQLDSSSEIGTDAELSDTGNKIGKIFDVSIKPLKDDVTPGSYVPIKITVENDKDGYLSDSLVITKAPGLTEENSKVATLLPKDKDEVFWIVEIPDDAQQGFVYTTTIEVKDQFGETSKDTITYSSLPGYEDVSLKEAEGIIDALSPEDEDKFSNQIVLNCNPTKKYFYSFQTPEIKCLVRTFNSNVNGLSLCTDDNCKNFDMPKNTEREFTFNVSTDKEIFSFELKNSDISIKRNVLVSIYDKPRIQIFGLDLDAVVYDESIEIPITIKSDTPLKNVKMKINNLNPISFDELDGTKEFTLETNTKAFSSERVDVRLEFEDEYGNPYSQRTTNPISVHNLPWYYTIVNFFRNLF